MRVKNWIGRHTFLLRLLSSTVLIACIPLLIISSMLITSERNGLETAQKERLSAVSQAVATQLDAYVDAMLAIHYRAIASPKLNPATMQSRVADEMEAIQTLSDLQVALPFVKTFGLSLGGTPGSIYLSEGKYDMDVFASRRLGVSADKLKAWLEQVRESGRAFSRWGDYGDYVLYGIPARYTEVQSTTLFVLPRKTLLDALSSLLSRQYLLAEVCGADGELIYAAVSAPQQGRCTAISPKGVTVTLCDLAAAALPASSQQTILALCIVLITVLAAVGIALSNYAPLIRLVKSMPQESRLSDAPANEFSTISQVLSEQFRIEEDLSSKLENQTSTIANRALRTLLEGHAPSPEDAALFGQRPAFYVLCTPNVADASLPGVYTVSVENQDIRVHVLFCKDQAEADLRQTAAALRQKLGDENARVGVSNWHGDLGQMRLAYIEALSALRAAAGPVTQISDVDAPGAILPSLMPIDMAQLVNGLRLGTDYPIEHARELLDGIERGTTNAALRRYACFQVLELYRKAARKAEVQLDTERVIFDVAEGNFATFRAGLMECLGSLHSEQQQEKQEAGKLLELRMIRYIDANVTDPRMCLGMIAEHFQLSIYTVSRLAKSTLGVNINDYLRDKRLEQACALFSGSELTIAAIAERTGFSSPSYFISVFKKTARAHTCRVPQAIGKARVTIQHRNGYKETRPPSRKGSAGALLIR